MTFDMEVGLGPSHIVLDGDPAPLPQKGDRARQFSAHFYFGQTAGWTKMALGMEVGLSPGDFVLDGDPDSHPLKGHSPPNYRPMSVVGKRLEGRTKMVLGMEVGLSPGDFVFDGDPTTPEQRAHPPPPIFWPMFIVTKRLDG